MIWLIKLSPSKTAQEATIRLEAGWFLVFVIGFNYIRAFLKKDLWFAVLVLLNGVIYGFFKLFQLFN
jgi:hypothetical protein